MKRFVFAVALLTASIAQAQAVVIRSSKSVNMLDVVTNGVDAGSGGLTNGLMCMGSDGTLAHSVLVDTSGVQSVNVAKINGVTTLMGNGVTGTGSQRVTIASDNTSYSVGTKTTNAAVPGATNVGALVAVANAAPPTLTETYLAALYTDLSGNLRTISGLCASRLHTSTVVGVAAGNTPAAQLAGRRYVTLCNSLQNTGTPLVKCRVDGTSPVMAVTNAGDVLGLGDCIQYDIAAGVVPSCISDAAGTNVTSFECL